MWILEMSPAWQGPRTHGNAKAFPLCGPDLKLAKPPFSGPSTSVYLRLIIVNKKKKNSNCVFLLQDGYSLKLFIYRELPRRAAAPCSVLYITNKLRVWGGGGERVLHQRVLNPPDPVFFVHMSVCLSFLHLLTGPVKFPESSCIGQSILPSFYHLCSTGHNKSFTVLRVLINKWIN